MAVIMEGLILRKESTFSSVKERLDHVTVYDTPFDEVYFHGNESPCWRHRGSYETHPRLNRVIKHGYHVLLEGVGHFKTMIDYRFFVECNMRATIIEEVWEGGCDHDEVVPHRHDPFGFIDGRCAQCGMEGFPIVDPLFGSVTPPENTDA